MKLTDFSRIFDHHAEHALRLFREKDTGVVRLQASVLTGEMKRRPIWTAFITRQIHMPKWASWDSKKVVILADLQQFVFTNYYSPQYTSTGEFLLTFISSSGTTLLNLVVLVSMLIRSDADDFMASIEDLKNTAKRQHHAENADEFDDN